MNPFPLVTVSAAAVMSGAGVLEAVRESAAMHPDRLVFPAAQAA